MRFTSGLVLLVIAQLCLPHPSDAQRRRGDSEDSASESELAEARALFMAGQAAVDSGRWADAVDNFSRAYELSQVPAALYNLGFALRALGKHREARDAFAQLLDEHDQIDRQLRREAQRYRDEAQSRIAVVTLDGLAEGSRYQIRFDGQDVADDGERPIRVEANAGTHTVTVRAPEFQPFVWEGELADGERTTVDVEMQPVVVSGPGRGGGRVGPDRVGGAVDPDEGGILSSPLFWIVTAVVVLGGGALAAYFINEGAQLEGNSPRVIELD